MFIYHNNCTQIIISKKNILKVSFNNPRVKKIQDGKFKRNNWRCYGSSWTIKASSLISKFVGNQISWSAFLNSCDMAILVGIKDQYIFVQIHLKNKLIGKDAELINLRNKIFNWIRYRR